MPAARHRRFRSLLSRRSLRRWRSHRKLPDLLRLLVVGLAAIVVLPIVSVPVLAAQEVSGLPRVGGLSAQSLNQDTLIYDRHGQLLADIGASGDHRIVVPLKYISPLVKQATIATEDRNFYHNDGVDLGSITRAAIANYTHHRISQGGSTISQQLVKQVFIGPNASATIDRKIREGILALELNQQYSKDQILEMYLNTIYYGSQSYGIEAAARDYFQVSAHDLTLAQAAMLAGLPQAPTRYNPVLHPQLAKTRQAEVLQAMVAEHNITKEQADRALAEPLTFYPPINKLNAPHFVDYVLSVLAKNFHIRPSDRKGYRITTSLDLGLQHQAEAIVRDQIAAVGDYYNFHDAALVSLDPKTGQVLAMVGGNDYNRTGGQINMAVTPRQPGSSFKMFTYTAAIESRQVNMVTPILDEPLVFPLGAGKDGLLPYQPQNYDRRYHGTVPLKMAMGNSLNIPALKVELRMGIPTVLSAARRMGVTSLTQPDDFYRMSLTLGGYEVPLLDMATGASTLATLGVRHDPAPIVKIEDGLGRSVFHFDPKKNETRAIDPQVAFIIASIMSDDRNRCLEFGCNGDLTLPGRHVAAKTGTTQDFRDNWTVGFTPSLTTAVWVGNPDYTPLSHNSTGIVGAAPIWHRFMQTTLGGTPDEWYDVPAGVEQSWGNYYLPGTQRISSTLAYSWPRCRFWRYDPATLTNDQQMVDGVPCVLNAMPWVPSTSNQDD
jgi:1A family penicillin-binding protein